MSRDNWSIVSEWGDFSLRATHLNLLFSTIASARDFAAPTTPGCNTLLSNRNSENLQEPSKWCNHNFVMSEGFRRNKIRASHRNHCQDRSKAPVPEKGFHCCKFRCDWVPRSKCPGERRNRLPEGLSIWGGRGRPSNNNKLSGSMDKSIIMIVIRGWGTSTSKIRS
jgi:hypothetical protein